YQPRPASPWISPPLTVIPRSEESSISCSKCIYLLSWHILVLTAGSRYAHFQQSSHSKEARPSRPLPVHWENTRSASFRGRYDYHSADSNTI
ncbi:hypothetical protein ARMGADRAFT_728875, partial [Armillaria gallica]